MIKAAQVQGVNATVGARFVKSMVMSGMSEVLAYGTTGVVEEAPSA